MHLCTRNSSSKVSYFFKTCNFFGLNVEGRCSHEPYLLCAKKVKKIDLFINSEKDFETKNSFGNSFGCKANNCCSLCAHLAELSRISNKEITALACVAPTINQSGASKDKAAIEGGKTLVRNCLYVAALMSIRYSSILRHFYGLLWGAGKAYYNYKAEVHCIT